MRIPALRTWMDCMLCGLLVVVAGSTVMFAVSNEAAGHGNGVAAAGSPKAKGHSDPRPGSGARPTAGAPEPLPPEPRTAEDTARIAAAAGFFDVVGIKLGMPLKDAMNLLKAHNAQMKVVLSRPQRYDVFPNVDFVTAVLAGTPYYDETKRATSLNGRTEGELVLLGLTVPPNAPVVSRISRQLSYARGEGPTRDNAIAGLREKYGAESAVREGPEPMEFIWVFDGQGRRQSGPEISYATCTDSDPFLPSPNFPANAFSFTGDYAGHINVESWAKGGLAEDKQREDERRMFPPAAFEARQRIAAFCRNVTMIHANVQTEGPRGSVRLITVEAINTALALSSRNSTYEMFKDAVEKRDKKKEEEAKKKGVPKF